MNLNEEEIDIIECALTDLMETQLCFGYSKEEIQNIEKLRDRFSLKKQYGKNVVSFKKNK